jgi:hypothetical protein
LTYIFLTYIFLHIIFFGIYLNMLAHDHSPEPITNWCKQMTVKKFKDFTYTKKNC